MLRAATSTLEAIRRAWRQAAIATTFATASTMTLARPPRRARAQARKCSARRVTSRDARLTSRDGHVECLVAITRADDRAAALAWALALQNASVDGTTDGNTEAFGTATNRAAATDGPRGVKGVHRGDQSSS
jgi:hypothetical protein